MNVKLGLILALGAAAAGLAVLVHGCAGHHIVRDGTGDGYDVYRPEPYILVASFKEGEETKSTASLIWLPNFSRRYRISTSAFLAKAEFGLEIKDGWMLTGLSEKLDTTALPVALLEMLAKLPIPTKAPGGHPSVELYRIVIDESEGTPPRLEKVPGLPEPESEANAQGHQAAQTAAETQPPGE